MGLVRSKKGFTLLEVLVSLVILGICFGVLFETLSQSKRICWRSTDAAEAARIAHNLLQDTGFVKDLLDKRSVEDSVKGEDDWRYSASVSELKIGEDRGQTFEIPSMVELRLCLWRKHGNDARKFCITRWYRR